MWSSWAVCASGAAVEFGWAVGESLMVPHLIGSLGMRPGTASLIYLVNPVLGLPLQPIFGAKVDSYTGYGAASCGKRRPFIIMLGLVAALAMALLVWSDASGDGSPRGSWSMHAQVLFAFCVYASLDLVNDFLLVPGRALALDVLGATDATDAKYSSAQGIGRLLALLVGALPLEKLLGRLVAALRGGGGGGGDDDGDDGGGSGDPTGAAGVTIFQALFAVNLLVMLGCVGLSVSCGRGGSRGSSRGGTVEPQQAGQEDGDGDGEYDDDEKGGGGQGASEGEEQEGEQAAGLLAQMRQQWTRLDGAQRTAVGALLSVQVGGWVVMQTMAYWCTQWLGPNTTIPGTSLRLAYIGQGVQVAVALGCTSVLPRLHGTLGVARTYLAGELVMALCLAASPLLGPERPYATLALLSVGGVGWAVHNTSAFVLCRLVVRAPNAMAFFVSIICTTCAFAQVLVGGLSGLLVQACGDSITTMFAWVGALMATVEVCVWLASERDGFFRRGAADDFATCDPDDALAEKLLASTDQGRPSLPAFSL